MRLSIVRSLPNHTSQLHKRLLDVPHLKQRGGRAHAIPWNRRQVRRLCQMLRRLLKQPKPPLNQSKVIVCRKLVWVLLYGLQQALPPRLPEPGRLFPLACLLRPDAELFVREPLVQKWHRGAVAQTNRLGVILHRLVHLAHLQMHVAKVAVARGRQLLWRLSQVHLEEALGRHPASLVCSLKTGPKRRALDVLHSDVLIGGHGRCVQREGQGGQGGQRDRARQVVGDTPRASCRPGRCLVLASTQGRRWNGG
mmetsp:Transcript_3228/g.9541  ORF Transcript_3228/g.9541 Transcript_3228/m.9541 type:complete len:252 (-) Transcript_3228:76-831(-)